MNLFCDILGKATKGALIKFFKMIFFAIIVLIVVYVVGIFTNKKANALVIKNSQQIHYVDNNDRVTQEINATTTTSTSVEFALTQPLTTSYDLVGFNMARFGIHGTLGSANYSQESCTINYLNGQQSSYSCSGSSTLEKIVADYVGNGTYYHVYGFVRYSDGTQGTCYRSTEYENYIMCPTNNSSITSFVWRMNTAIFNQFNGIYFHVTMNDEVLLFNYDSTDIINGLGNITQQQQQTNQTLTDGNVSGATSNATTQISGVETAFNQRLHGTNELTQMVFAPFSALSTIAQTQCTPITWDIPLVNYQATIPCLSTYYNQYFSGILTLFATVITAIYGYHTVVKLVSTIKDALDAESDKIEVIDL